MLTDIVLTEGTVLGYCVDRGHCVDRRCVDRGHCVDRHCVDRAALC